MSKVDQLDNILCDLDSLYGQLKSLNVSKDTMDCLQKLADAVELDLREAAVDYDPE